jgi:hypothetical protein
MNAPRTPLWKATLPAAAFTLLGPFAACNSGNIPIGQDNKPIMCATSADCPPGDACATTQVCAPACAADADCPPNEACVSGVCEKPATGCLSNADCPPNETCVSGVCKAPAAGCLSDADCPPNETCVSGVCKQLSPPSLQWFYTCGDPVCHGHTSHPGVASCTTEMPGQTCTTSGQECDPGDSCDRLLLCTTTDPTKNPGGCPISRARFKHDIRYLPEAALARLREDLMTMRLTTWRYNHEGEAGREHLGFIIDDNPDSPSVDASGDHVDLYGYTSMAVAAIQMQDRELAAQRKQIEALQRGIDALREEVRACRGPR